MPQRLPVWIVGIVRAEKKTVKGNCTADPSSNVMNYVKLTIVMAAAIGLKQYLEDQNILPKKRMSLYILLCLFGGNYLARYLSGDDPKAALEEKKGTTKVSKLTKPLMPNTKEIERSSLTGLKRSTKTKNWPNKTSLTPTTPLCFITGCTKMSRSRSTANQSFLTFTSAALCKNKASWFLLALVLFSRIRCLSILAIKLMPKTLKSLSQTLFRGIFDHQNNVFRSCPFWLILFCIFFWRSKPVSGRNPSVCIPAQPWRFLFLIGFPRRPKALCHSEGQFLHGMPQCSSHVNSSMPFDIVSLAKFRHFFPKQDFLMHFWR